MFKELTIKETRELLRYAGTFASDSLMDVSLCLYPKYYRLCKAFQCIFRGDCQELISLLSTVSMPEVPDDCKVTVVLEMTTACTEAQSDDIRSWAEAQYGTGTIERFEPVFLYHEDFMARITVIYHDACRRRSFHSSINCQSRYQRDMDIRIGQKLDDEISLNEEAGAIISLEADDICDMLIEHHFLWTDVANSTCSASDIVKRFLPDMERILQEFDVTGLILFIEVDGGYTTMGEVEALKQRFVKLVGEGIDVAINVRVRDSFIKSITCRATLIGSPKYIKGEVFQDYGRYEIMLYESENKDRGHVIVASYADEEFTLSRYDWAVFGDKVRGETDDHHFFDKDNTAKLFAALNVRKPEALLRTVRRRFATSMPSSADSHLLVFCTENGIQYKSDCHYDSVGPMD